MNDADAKELLDDLTGFLEPLIPPDCKWVLWIKPDATEFKYWGGTMTNEEFDEVVRIRWEKIMAHNSAEWLAWFKKGPPK